MYTDRMRIGLTGRTCYINSYHVCIRHGDKVVFQREDPGADNWYDDAHKEVCKAIQALDNVLALAKD